MKLRRVVIWRLAAVLLWIVSLGCLVRAIGDGVTAEESRHNPELTNSGRSAIQSMSATADRWAGLGWILQALTAALLSLGIETPRMVRRIFISLGLLIAADGTALLLVAVIVH